MRTILRDTASHDGFTGPGWNHRFGAGKVDAAAALAAVTGGGWPTATSTATTATTVLDVVLLVNHIVSPGNNPLTTEQREAADVFPAGGGDGTLNISDVTRIVAFILGTATPGRVIPDTPATFAVGVPVLADGAWWLPGDPHWRGRRRQPVRPHPCGRRLAAQRRARRWRRLHRRGRQRRR